MGIRRRGFDSKVSSSCSASPDDRSQRTFHDILEFVDVARPVVLFQRSDDVQRNLRDAPTKLPLMSMNEEPHQRLDILPSITQCRHGWGTR
jgi:hypothetical protein